MLNAERLINCQSFLLTKHKKTLLGDLQKNNLFVLLRLFSRDLRSQTTAFQCSNKPLLVRKECIEMFISISSLGLDFFDSVPISVLKFETSFRPRDHCLDYVTANFSYKFSFTAVFRIALLSKLLFVTLSPTNKTLSTHIVQRR